jgi:hypothetical protein
MPLILLRSSTALLALLAVPTVAQQTPMGEHESVAPTCPAPVAPTGALAPWSAPVPMQAGADGDHAKLLHAGQAGEVELLPTAQVHYPLAPEKAGGADSHGGVLMLDVAKAGTWRIALGSAAWLDVVGSDGAQRSVAHGHGPDCTGIRKMVDFALKPGRYMVQISSSSAAKVRVLATAL